VQVYLQGEVSELEFNGKLKDKQIQEWLNPISNQTVDHFNKEPTEEHIQFWSSTAKLILTYFFFLQTDIELHKLYVYFSLENYLRSQQIVFILSMTRLS